jgi:hypothetical protein
MKLPGFALAATIAAGIAAFVVGCGDMSTQADNHPANNHGKTPDDQLMSCTTFNGLTHCPSGAATLNVTGAKLKVGSFGTSGADGVNIGLNNVREWEGVFSPYHSGSNNKLFWTASSNGNTVAGLNMIQMGSTDSFKVSAFFTGAPSGSKYKIEVFQDSTYQGGQDSVDGNDGSGPSYGTLYVNSDGKLVFIWTASVVSPGACQWQYFTAGGSIRAMKLPNGTPVYGNRFVFTEQLASGQYPYNQFDGVSARGVLDSLTLKSESVQY